MHYCIRVHVDTVPQEVQGLSEEKVAAPPCGGVKDVEYLDVEQHAGHGGPAHGHKTVSGFGEVWAG